MQSTSYGYKLDGFKEYKTACAARKASEMKKTLTNYPKASNDNSDNNNNNT